MSDLKKRGLSGAVAVALTLGLLALPGLFPAFAAADTTRTASAVAPAAGESLPIPGGEPPGSAEVAGTGPKASLPSPVGVEHPRDAEVPGAARRLLHRSGDGSRGAYGQTAEDNRSIYEIPARPYHRKGERLVGKTGKECRECHLGRFYPQGDFFGWEYRKKWQVHWLLFSMAAFFLFAGAYVSVQVWRRGKRSSLHHPVHWPSVSRGLLDQAVLGKRVYRHSRLRWTIFFAISMAFVALTAVFLLTLVFRFLLPAGNPVTDTGGLVLDFLADLLGGVVALGVLLALYRRTLGKGPHLKSEPEDFIILFLLFAIVLTGFFLEACRLAVVSPEPRIWASFLGAALASVLRSWEAPWTVVRFYGWLLHAVLVFAFLAYLPFSKLFHLITSPISIAATASESHYRQQQ